MKKIVICFLVWTPQFLSAQEFKADERNALINVLVTDFNDKPLIGEIIIFESAKTKKTFESTSGKDGKTILLLPKGDKYKVKYKSFLEQKDYSELEIPSEEGEITANVTIQIETGTKHKTYTLENVFFDTGKATLRNESYKALNVLVEAMKVKPALVIEIGGHTDDVGTPESNMALSQGRADAVKAYLVKNGISATRVLSKGYGQTHPVASNESESGRQKNRRTEVKIIKE